MKSIIKSRTEAKPFNSTHGTLYYRNYSLENGDNISLGAKDEDPKWAAVGMELEYEENGVNSKGNPKYKRVSNFQVGGGKPRTKSLSDIIRMCKSNAVHAMVEVNGAYGEERITSKDLAAIVEFTLGGISADIQLFGEEDSLLTSRLASVNNAAQSAKYKSFGIQDMLALAKAYYSYIKG